MVAMPRTRLGAAVVFPVRPEVGPEVHEVDAVVVLDSGRRPGGAWQHRWPTLRMAGVNGIEDLPGLPMLTVDAELAASVAVPAYFARPRHRPDKSPRSA
jgi:hypothetical protein